MFELRDSNARRAAAEQHEARRTAFNARLNGAIPLLTDWRQVAALLHGTEVGTDWKLVFAAVLRVDPLQCVLSAG